MKIFIKDNKIIKTIMDAYVGKEYEPEADEVVTQEDSTEYIVYEDGQVKLYADSQAKLDRIAFLQSKEELTEMEQKELEYLTK